MGIHGEEAGLTFSRIEKKTLVLRPMLLSKQSSLCGFYSCRNRGGEVPASQDASIKRAADKSRERRKKIINKKREKTGQKLILPEQLN